MSKPDDPGVMQASVVFVARRATWSEDDHDARLGSSGGSTTLSVTVDAVMGR
jgi:hypothetical protein